MTPPRRIHSDNGSLIRRWCWASPLLKLLAKQLVTAMVPMGILFASCFAAYGNDLTPKSKSISRVISDWTNKEEIRLLFDDFSQEAPTEEMDRICTSMKIECGPSSVMVRLNLASDVKILLAGDTERFERIMIFTDVKSFLDTTTERKRLVLEFSEDFAEYVGASGDCPSEERKTQLSLSIDSASMVLNSETNLPSCDGSDPLIPFPGEVADPSKPKVFAGAVDMAFDQHVNVSFYGGDND